MYRIAGPEEMRPVGEVEFVQGLAAASASGLYGSGRAAASIVGHANLNLGDGVKPVLEALQAASPNRFRGIRHSVTWDPHPEIENTAAHQAANQMSSDNFRAGARVLASMGLTLEGWMYFPQMFELAEFAKARARPDHHPEPHRRAAARRAVQQQRGDPGDLAQRHRGGGGGVPTWSSSWAASGCRARALTGTSATRRPAPRSSGGGHMAPLIHYCIEQFGPDRCMFESNFPCGQGFLLVQRDVQRLQAPVPGLLGRRARGDVPRHGGARVPGG